MKQLLLVLLLLFTYNIAFAYTDTQICNAIFKAEHSKNHPYGILKHYKHTTPRQASLNTIRHARGDWDGKGDFIEFLGSRYCPTHWKNTYEATKAEWELNRYWVKNVKYFLERED